MQVEDVTLEGLYGHDYRDAAKGNVVVRDTGTHIAVEGEMDRVYRRVKRPQLLQAGNLSLAIQGRAFPMSWCGTRGSTNAPRWPICRPMAGGTCCASRRWPSSRSSSPPATNGIGPADPGRRVAALPAGKFDLH